MYSGKFPVWGSAHQKWPEAHGPLAEPHTVGCVALIKEFDKRSDGNIALTALASSRFRILAIKNKNPYLTAMIEYIPMEIIEESIIQKKALALRKLIEQYLTTRAKGDTMPAILNTLPEDPLTLGYFAASILEATPLKKQKLLSLTNQNQFLQQLLKMYKYMITVDQLLRNGGKTEYMGPFSVN